VEGLASGVTGLIVGALLGLLASVLFEDFLKSQIQRIGSFARRLRARGPLPVSSEEFRLGPLHAPLVIMEGDGEQVINEQSVRLVVDPVDVRVPAEMAQWVEEVRVEEERKKAAGLPHFWNGPNYAVTGLTVSRTMIDESPEICLHLSNGVYYTFLARQQLDRPFADGSTPRSRYLTPNDPRAAPAFMCCSFGTNVAVVTSDNLLVVQQRAQQVGSQPGTWSSSANEALSRQLDSRGRTAPDLYDVMRRGIAEELSIDKSEYHLEMLAVVVDTERQQWGALFVAFLHELTAEDVLQRRSRGVPDKWEHDQIEFVRFEIEPVVRHLLRADRRDHWSSVGPPLFYLSLVRRYGRAAVERRTARILRSLR
jgi:hypothetical protein